ncbi:cation-transporting P-type ATPase [Exiguobacterium sp. s70]|uniref:cation-transporting P-type ATPase n=1 Tax=Exiguobacterium sp. s70 TaxID=2751228 RepID=UPI001BE98CB2|nr:cation-transporting P-type ATPase [Exiguobacterium sp. s70]
MKLDSNDPFWTRPPEELLQTLNSTPQGLTSDEVKRRQQTIGLNVLAQEKRLTKLTLLLEQFKSPIILILIGATLISALTGDYVDASIILTIILASALLSFFQEFHANRAIEELREKVNVHVDVWRDHQLRQVSASDIVPR